MPSWFGGDKKKKLEKKIAKTTKKLDKRKQKQLTRKQWAQAKAQAEEDNVSLYYSCGKHNVNGYTPWGHDEICGG